LSRQACLQPHQRIHGHHSLPNPARDRLPLSNATQTHPTCTCDVIRWHCQASLFASFVSPHFISTRKCRCSIGTTRADFNLARIHSNAHTAGMHRESRDEASAEAIRAT
jgi:hypothetical protein